MKPDQHGAIKQKGARLAPFFMLDQKLNQPSHTTNTNRARRALEIRILPIPLSTSVQDINLD
jgi:hypothetical protein